MQRLKKYYNRIIRLNLLLKFKYTNCNQILSFNKLEIKLYFKSLNTNYILISSLIVQLISCSNVIILKQNNTYLLYSILKKNNMFYFLDQLIINGFFLYNNQTFMEPIIYYSKLQKSLYYVILLKNLTNFLQINVEFFGIRIYHSCYIYLYFYSKKPQECIFLLNHIKIPFNLNDKALI